MKNRDTVQTGAFSNSMAYATWGAGPKSLIVIPGGPGNAVPPGFMIRRRLQPLLRPLVHDGYRAWVVTRRRNMPEGHSVADMANDYAALIDDEFDGHVDLVLGVSYGGMITLYLAADHPDRAEHFIVAGAAHEISDRGKDIDYRMALAISNGDRNAAGMAMGEYMIHGDRYRWLRRLLAPGLGRIVGGAPHEHYRHDIMVEAEAELAFDARDALPRISVPILLVCGGRDLFVPRDVVEEAARLIPHCTLLIYSGQGHSASSSKRLGSDALVYVRTCQANRPRTR